MDQLQSPEPMAPITRLLVEAVRCSGRSRRDIARRAGMHKDVLMRTLNGSRAVTFDEVMRILRTADVSPELTLALALTAGEDAALDLMRTELAAFIGELFRLVPKAIGDQLGEQVCEIRPRWATGMARIIAKMLSEHIADVARREAALGGV